LGAKYFKHSALFWEETLRLEISVSVKYQESCNIGA